MVRKSILDAEISEIQIDAEQCFRLEVVTHKGDELVLTAQMEGEYQNDLELTMKRDGNVLHLATRFDPFFRHPNDKLSAHKVVSIVLSVLLPEHKSVKIKGKDTQTQISGAFEGLFVRLADGNCSLEGQVTTGKIQTVTGHIELVGPQPLSAVETKYGETIEGPVKLLEQGLELRSVSGNIVLQDF
ncbi:hypothetical protein [Sediminicola luteus]|uniref:Adhesin domain-containing protein n=1 Tax=Sediminicola luteus TaxID=319238 RepID=A0A2A4G4E3_9FLAO|nr:hypothetical protein [Sediminicola luteus]PCE62848.1 hypothetical protein B7P33_16340 [Sediminicola luteus]